MARIGAAREDENALFPLGIVGSLLFVDAACGVERIKIADAAERALRGHEVEIGVLDVVVVRLGGVHPPGIRTIVQKFFGIAPVEFASLPAGWIIGASSAGTADGGVVRPGVDVEEEAFFLHHFELLGLLSEVGPDHEHGVCIQVMDAIEHLFRLGEAGVQELHGVPVVVVFAPVLPVLNDAVERDMELTVFLDDFEELGLRLVAFAALPEPERPERLHRAVAGELAHLRDDAVGGASEHEVVVQVFAVLEHEGQHVVLFLELAAGGIVQENAVSFHRLEHRDGDEAIALMDRELAAALGEFVVLRLAKPVNLLVGIHAELGRNGLRLPAGILNGSHFERFGGVFGEQARAVRPGERDRACFAVQHHTQNGGFRRDCGVCPVDFNLDLFRLEDDGWRDEGRFRAVDRGLGDADDFGRIEDDGRDDGVVFAREPVLFCDFAHVDLLRFKH